jgi:hypothetical protein
MKSFWAENKITYDGTQLSSHFAYRNFQIAGDSIVGFIGSAKVLLTELVDIEDIIAKEPISSDLMLHFIVELFQGDLLSMVFLQRLLMSKIADELNLRMGKLLIKRDGDDLYYEERKLSVSIATASPISKMIHCALNIKNTGTPIPVSCLEEIGADPEDFGKSILKSFTHEMEEMEFARVKVNWVK